MAAILSRPHCVKPTNNTDDLLSAAGVGAVASFPADGHSGQSGPCPAAGGGAG